MLEMGLNFLKSGMGPCLGLGLEIPVSPGHLPPQALVRLPKNLRIEPETVAESHRPFHEAPASTLQGPLPWLPTLTARGKASPFPSPPSGPRGQAPR